MPGSYLIDVPRRIVFSRGWGKVTEEEVLAHARALRDDPRFEPGFRQLIDFRDIDRFELTSAGVQHIAQRNPFRTDARRAFVVAQEEVFGMIRMYWSYAEADPKQFRVFRAIGPALEWIGLNAAEPWPATEPDVFFGVG
jgi:hypothetical protein